MRKLLVYTLIVAGAISSSISVSNTSALAAAPCKLLSKSMGVDIGESTGYAWTKSGNAYAWGRGDWGMRGDNSSTYAKNKPQLMKVVKNVVKIASYGGAALVLQRDGSVFATGYNSSGQLGIGSTKSKKIPTKVNLKCVVDIAAGRTTSYALKADGTVWAWGYNADEELNVGNSYPALKPQRVLGLSQISTISAGEDNFFAVDKLGNVFAMGYNSYGQLATGTTSAPDVLPVALGHLNLKDIQIAGSTVAGLDFSTGDVWMWGDSSRATPSSMGNSIYTPQIVPIGSNWKSFTLGWDHGLVLDQNQNLWAWGSNRNGALGAHLGTFCTISETENHECSGYDYWTGLYSKESDTPLQILSGVVKVAAGDDFSLAVKTDGSVWSWGNGGDGQLGNGYSYDSDKPSRVYKLNLLK